MSGPWEKYGANVPSGPWAKYASSASPSPTPARGTEAPQAPSAPLSWAEAGKEAVENIPESTGRAISNIAQPFLHPIQTAESVYKTGVGEAEKVTGIGGDDQKYADAANHYFSDRYGSLEGLKKAVATDPVGVAMDISTVFTGGETALSRAPGIVGDVGKVSGKIGEFTNPVALATKASSKLGIPQKVGSAAADFIGYFGAHTGGQAIKYAARAGAQGHQAAQAFLDHMRGNAPIGDIVSSAKQAVGKMREARSSAYRAGMKGVSQDKTVLDFTDIDKHIASTDTVKNYKGIDLSPKTAAVRDEIKTAINEWKTLTPAEYHTPEGFDALKQRISDIRDHLQYGTPERLIADQAYHAVRETIVKQTPVYGKIMKDYEEASRELDEMQKTLSLNPKASVDTAARKLLSIMRNNVNTNFGRRAELGKVLERHGAKTLPYQLAGETMRPMWPTSGFGRAEGGAGALAALALHKPEILATLPLMSPRLMGEAAFRIGQGSRALHAAHVPKAALVARALGGTNNAQDVADQLGAQ